jgi:hypothetical protein
MKMTVKFMTSILLTISITFKLIYMNNYVAFIEFLNALGYDVKNLSFSEGVDLFTNVKNTVSNKIGLPVESGRLICSNEMKVPAKYKPTGVGVSSGMDGECLRSYDLPVNNLDNDLDSLIIETPVHLV